MSNLNDYKFNSENFVSGSNLRAIQLKTELDKNNYVTENFIELCDFYYSQQSVANNTIISLFKSAFSNTLTFIENLDLSRLNINKLSNVNDLLVSSGQIKTTNLILSTKNTLNLTINNLHNISQISNVSLTNILSVAETIKIISAQSVNSVSANAINISNVFSLDKLKCKNFFTDSSAIYTNQINLSTTEMPNIKSFNTDLPINVNNQAVFYSSLPIIKNINFSYLSQGNTKGNFFLSSSCKVILASEASSFTINKLLLPVKTVASTTYNNFYEITGSAFKKLYTDGITFCEGLSTSTQIEFLVNSNTNTKFLFSGKSINVGKFTIDNSNAENFFKLNFYNNYVGLSVDNLYLSSNTFSYIKNHTIMCQNFSGWSPSVNCHYFYAYLNTNQYGVNVYGKIIINKSYELSGGKKIEQVLTIDDLLGKNLSVNGYFDIVNDYMEFGCVNQISNIRKDENNDYIADVYCSMFYSPNVRVTGAGSYISQMHTNWKCMSKSNAMLPILFEDYRKASHATYNNDYEIDMEEGTFSFSAVINNLEWLI